MYVVLRTAHSNHPWRHAPMGTRGKARMSRLKSASQISLKNCTMCATSKWMSGRNPNIANKVLIVYDGEFNYTCRVSPTFDHTKPRNLRTELSRCFEDRWFPYFGDYPGAIWVYDGGEPIYKATFILHRRHTDRFPRNDIQFKINPREWARLLQTLWLQAYSLDCCFQSD